MAVALARKTCYALPMKNALDWLACLWMIGFTCKICWFYLRHH